MESITGTASISLAPATTAPAGPPHTYFGIANSMLSGVKVLAGASPPPALPLAMLCAHTLECILKAYLSRGGDDSRVKQRGVRHNLNALWTLASKEGLPISDTTPSWVTCLSGLHNFPYHLRYSTGVHGIVFPAPEPMISELAALLDQVRSHL